VVHLAVGLFARRSEAVTGSAVMGALAAPSTVILPVEIQPAFPVLPFLRYAAPHCGIPIFNGSSIGVRASLDKQTQQTVE